MNENAKIPGAILWDMDGTLLDTEPDWIASETALCATHGVVWTEEDGLGLVGNPLPYSAEVLRGRGLDMAVPDIIEALLVEMEGRVRRAMPWQPDARRFLDWAIEREIPCAIVTMSYRSLARALTDVEPYFSVVVTGEEVTRGKPDPEPYLLAAERLGIPIERCLAIEDSPAGVRSAAASGARAVGVRRLNPIERLPGLSRVATLDALTPAVVDRLLSGDVVDDLGDGS